jgi:hypothetical protein
MATINKQIKITSVSTEKLVIEVYPDAEGYISTTGKTRVLATTNKFKPVEEVDGWLIDLKLVKKID